MKTTLKKAVRNLLAHRALDETRFRRLDMLQAPYREAANNAADRTRRIARFAVVAASVAVVAISAYLISQYAGPPPLETLIADEVAANHIKLKPLEVRTDDMRNIRDYFTELEFKPVNSRLVDLRRWELLGGRYCSIQGKDAAQLRVKDVRSGAVHSLYQASYSKARFADLPELEEGAAPIDVLSRGLRIKIWVEQGVLFALTEDPKRP